MPGPRSAPPAPLELFPSVWTRQEEGAELRRTRAANDICPLSPATLTTTRTSSRLFCGSPQVRPWVAHLGPSTSCLASFSEARGSCNLVAHYCQGPTPGRSKNPLLHAGFIPCAVLDFLPFSGRFPGPRALALPPCRSVYIPWRPWCSFPCAALTASHKCSHLGHANVFSSGPGGQKPHRAKARCGQGRVPAGAGGESPVLLHFQLLEVPTFPACGPLLPSLWALLLLPSSTFKEACRDIGPPWMTQDHLPNSSNLNCTYRLHSLLLSGLDGSRAPDDVGISVGEGAFFHQPTPKPFSSSSCCSVPTQLSIWSCAVLWGSLVF